jgi:hypothetical protein
MGDNALEYITVKFKCPKCGWDSHDEVLRCDTNKCAFLVHCGMCRITVRVILDTIACLTCSYQDCFRVIPDMIFEAEF